MTEPVRADSIYHALFDDRAFEALPGMLAKATGARSALIQWRHPDGIHEVLAWSHFSRDFIELYAAKFASLDPWVAAATHEQRFDELIRLDAHVTASDFDESRFHREFLAPWGDDTAQGVGAVFRTPWGEGLVSVQRGRGSPPFDVTELAALEECLPQLRRLLQVRGEIASYRRGPKVARDAFDDLGLAAVVTGGDGLVVRTNDAADRVLRRADGLLVQANRLTCADPAARTGLEAAIDRATAGSDPAATAIVVERSLKALAYMVSVTPMTGPGGRGRALIVFRDPDVAAPDRGLRLGRFPRLRPKAGPGGETVTPERAGTPSPPRVGVGVARTLVGLVGSFGFRRWSHTA
jgi:hypothetical protein